jgi:hypothetical protein
MDADREKLIRDLDKHARDAASHVAHLSLLWRRLMESDDPEMPPRDAVAADNALMDAMRALPELRRIFAKRARRLDGPPPTLILRATDDRGRLDIIAEAAGGDQVVGRAVRSEADGRASWHLTLTDPGSGRHRSSIGLHYEVTHKELLEALNRHMDDHGPWWGGEGS